MILLTDESSDATGGATIRSRPFGGHNIDKASIHLVWVEDTATYLGAFTLQASDIDEPVMTTDADWVDMGSDHSFEYAGDGVAPGGSGKDIIPVRELSAKWYRIKIVRTNGEATFQAYLTTRSQ